MALEASSGDYYYSDPTYRPTDCDPFSGPNGDNCTAIYVSTVNAVCLSAATDTCDSAATFRVYADSEAGGFMWGMVLSLIGDVIISCGLALQKVAHNRIEAQKVETMKASGGSLKADEVQGPAFTSMPIWWAGILMTVGGEVRAPPIKSRARAPHAPCFLGERNCPCSQVGNFAAYGDVNTPASVVTAVGCARAALSRPDDPAHLNHTTLAGHPPPHSPRPAPVPPSLPPSSLALASPSPSWPMLVLTPARALSVRRSCVGVIANSIIATFFLGEVFRRRDGVGIAFVLIGVILVVVYAPQQTKVLSAELLEEYLSSAFTIVYLILLFGSIIALYFLCPRFGHRHVLWNLSMASLIGSLTVMSSKAVSTFVIQTLEAFATGPIFDQVDLGQANATLCEEDGHHWEALNETGPFTYGCVLSNVNDTVRDAGGNIVIKGVSQHDNPFLYIALIIMIVTAVAQVKYLNLGMSMFGNSEVIPCHYVTFTLFSIIGTSITYQEFAIAYEGVCRIGINLHYFLDGCAFTFAGVWLITSDRAPTSEGNGALEDETPGTEMLALTDKRASEAVELNLMGGSNPPPPDDSCGGSGGLQEASSLGPLPSLGGSVGVMRDKVGELPKRTDIEARGKVRASMNDADDHTVASPRRPSMAESWGLPDGGLDARGVRKSRAASVSTFLSVLGGGHSAAFLFDPHDKHADAEEAAQLDAARTATQMQAEMRYSRTISMAQSMSRYSFSVGGAHPAPTASVSCTQGAPSTAAARLSVGSFHGEPAL